MVMTNPEAQAYAMVALNNLIKAGIIRVTNNKSLLLKLDSEMYYLFDRYSEDEIVDIMEDIMIGEDD